MKPQYTLPYGMCMCSMRMMYEFYGKILHVRWYRNLSIEITYNIALSYMIRTYICMSIFVQKYEKGKS